MESFNYPTEMVLAGMSLIEIKEHVFQEFLRLQPKPFKYAEELFKEWVFSDKFVFYPWPIRRQMYILTPYRVALCAAERQYQMIVNLYLFRDLIYKYWKGILSKKLCLL